MNEMETWTEIPSVEMVGLAQDLDTALDHGPPPQVRRILEEMRTELRAEVARRAAQS